ncbi:hypothetical protein XI05_09855 [Bradyrhizobium sp. CCBAU 11357]|nr:hypothetical protein [Bradyrhizobium sp. CCBAU 11357]
MPSPLEDFPSARQPTWADNPALSRGLELQELDTRVNTRILRCSSASGETGLVGETSTLAALSGL